MNSIAEDKPYLMSLFNWLETNGALFDLYSSGFLSKRAHLCMTAWLIVDSEMKTGSNKTSAVKRAADLCGVSETTIYSCLEVLENYKPANNRTVNFTESTGFLKHLRKLAKQKKNRVKST